SIVHRAVWCSPEPLGSALGRAATFRRTFCSCRTSRVGALETVRALVALRTVTAGPPGGAAVAPDHSPSPPHPAPVRRGGCEASRRGWPSAFDQERRLGVLRPECAHIVHPNGFAAHPSRRRAGATRGVPLHPRALETCRC